MALILIRGQLFSATARCNRHWNTPISHKRIRHHYNSHATPSHQDSSANGGNSGDNVQDIEIALDHTQTRATASEQVINDFGATRFDVAVRALRGEFDPPPDVANTERSVGVLLDSLVQWPIEYQFQLVVRNEAQEKDRCEALVEEYRRLVERVCATPIKLDTCSWKLRKAGKYLSICIPASVVSQEIISDVFEALKGDHRVLMKY